MEIEVVRADYSNEAQAGDISFLLNSYAADPMGGGRPLSTHTRENLVKELSKLAHAWSVICYVDGRPAGLVNCFEGFSTFKCKPLVNIHDVAVLPEFRGLGICRLMLEEVAGKAREKGCCKITLEVLEGNKSAQRAYEKFGFENYELDPTLGRAMFWEMNLDAIE